jgi:MFS family permease
VTPIIALTALQFGASVGLSALIVGLVGVGTLVGDLPASWVATRLGEKRALAVACLFDAIWLAVAFLAQSLVVLSIAIFAIGLSGSVIGLARQSYLTEATPVQYRARALSSLGGAYRIGSFIGPLAGAGIIALWSLQAAYVFAALMCLFAAVVNLLLPDLPDEALARRSDGGERPKLFSVLRSHSKVLATLGIGVLSMGVVRMVRQTVLPLWCESLGLDATHTSLIYAVSMGIDMSLFFLGGYIMDRFGRMWVAVPSMTILSFGLICLALAHSVTTVIIVACVLGLGNGIGSGIIMTLGSDASPDIGRQQFLSGWRLLSDSGQALGPVLLSAITTVASLAVATVSVGALTLVGTAWMGYWIQRHGMNRPRQRPPTGAN